MCLSFRISDQIKNKIKKTYKKDSVLKKAIYNKINEIKNSTEKNILHYKFLKYDLQKIQRVHILKKYVLTFIYFKNKKHILFLDFDHHNKIYKK
jgi:mRNA-degrading endonuclease RelE of RelBE toxin-antitoxin system